MSKKRCSNRMNSRGFLPHHDFEGVTQMITFRLADSMPKKVVYEKLRNARREESYRKWEEWLDKGAGSCVLGRPDCARVVRNALKFYDRKNYDLVEWVVMPNHVHFIYERPRIAMGDIVGRIKSFTAREIKMLLERPAGEPLWQTDYYDRGARDDRHLSRMIAYTLFNPVLAGLVDDPFEWEFSSIGKYVEKRQSILDWWREYEAERLYEH